MFASDNGVSDYPSIPEEAFLFVPHHSGDPAVRDDFKIGEQKKIRRLLFEGWAQNTYTPYENQQLAEYECHLQHKQI